ncbi:RNA polymerase sigma factor [Pseudonocardia spinosispora]|uniref:RNA polymerase sigma factor n=1 Tax=Pseudonocardia spinosispora TaxID=103441 RepID=UPI0004914A5A|nr:sigma-70 family RNA polymerase sigma factor [Pseudonocardia spinosispora]
MVLTATAIDDATLVVRAREGDLTAFEALVARYQKRIYQLALRMTRDRADAEDVTQEVFLTAWRRLPEIQQEAAFSGWLYTTATNRCLTLLRKRRPITALDEQDTHGEPAWTAPLGQDPQRSAQTMAQLEALSEALGQLTAAQRAVWLLREAHGRSYDEIARTMDTTPDSVRGRLSRARVQLAELMSPWH